ncbi:hypothetical protein Syun_017414 [Stephania yunnanensis]|uniref:Uncharacterized protein n=1 Tax=Stephania yunnanensis TaxID=152371 RepID=A0AAP0P2C9_9MAGN
MEEEHATSARSSPAAVRFRGGRRGSSGDSGVAALKVPARCWLLGVLAQHKEKEI